MGKKPNEETTGRIVLIRLGVFMLQPALKRFPSYFLPSDTRAEAQPSVLGGFAAVSEARNIGKPSRGVISLVRFFRRVKK